MIKALLIIFLVLFLFGRLFKFLLKFYLVNLVQKQQKYAQEQNFRPKQEGSIHINEEGKQKPKPQNPNQKLGDYVDYEVIS